MIGKPPPCLICKNYNENDFDKFSCKAFQNGIPDEIIMNESDHTEPLPEQDNDIVFEPLTEVEK